MSREDGHEKVHVVGEKSSSRNTVTKGDILHETNNVGLLGTNGCTCNMIGSARCTTTENFYTYD